MLRRLTFVVITLFLTASASYAQEEVDLTPIKDNTLYENDTGSLSNGAGDHLFAGRVGPGGSGTIRRAVLAFDVEGAVPEGATISGVNLTLNMSRTISGSQTTTVHRLTSDWGEGASHAAGEEGAGATAQSSDATWIHTFFDTDTWDNAGGDFVAAPSAAFDVGGLGSYSVESDGMVDDVQQWLDDPSSNFGWILIGNESTGSTSKRFDSRENATEANRPLLTITYSTNTSVEPSDLPRTLRIAGNFPNPFDEVTTIRFELDRAQPVSLLLYDVLGREVRALLNEVRPAGTHEVDVAADDLPAGTYLYCFESAAGECGRLTIVR